MITDELQSALEVIAQDSTLSAESEFVRRAEAIEQLDFYVIDCIDGLLQNAPPSGELHSLRVYAEATMRRLEDVDEMLFQRLRAELRAGHYVGANLVGLIKQYVALEALDSQSARVGYDSLDRFVNGLLGIQALPDEVRALEPEMVSYQQTPARVIFELAERAQLTPGDVFYDLGSGLGHVPILVHLLSGAPARGVELEPAYCAVARACAADLNLVDVQFINADARAADYTDGTVFFLYTPFEGMMLETVLARLRDVARTRAIRLVTYGPCTLQVAQQSWLAGNTQVANIHRLHAFRSV